MAGGSVTVSALRHRPWQALLVVLLSAVVTGAAALGPLYARAVEQSVLRNVVAGAPPSQSGIVVTVTGTRPPAPAQLAEAVEVGTPAPFGPAVQGADTRVLVGVAAGGVGLGGDGSAGPRDGRYRARLVSRAGHCRHLVVSTGRCVTGPDEVLVSRRTAASTGFEVGTSVQLVPEGAADPDSTIAVELVARVVGVYEAFAADDPYWSGRGQTGQQATRPGETDDLGEVDDLFVAWSTLAAAPWPQLRTHLDFPLDAGRVDLAAIPALETATTRIDRRARTVSATASSELAPLLRSVRSQREQARTVIPLLAVQLAVLGIVVLAFVCAAATEQRRPEIALARLRGLGTVGAATLLLRELGLLVVAGAVVGAGLGWLVASAATALWLEPGVVLEARWPVALAVAAAAVAGLLAIVAAALPTLRQPLASLLRRVPPRATTLQVGLVEGGVVAAAGASVVTLLAGGGGPVALLAPGLLAIAGGLLVAQAAIPTAGPIARRALCRGKVSWALAGVQIARRPALRRLITIVTVACALLVFAVDAWTVSDRNRSTRAGLEAGAPVVLTVDADSSLALRRVVLDIDPEGRFATPVVTIRSTTGSGPRTTAVEPDAFARIAHWGTDANRPTAAELEQITPALADPVELRGERVEVAADVDARALPLPGDQPLPELEPLGLTMTVEDSDGVLRRVDLGRVRDGSRTYDGDLPCPDGCRLRLLTVTRTFGDFADAFVTLQVSDVRAGPVGGDLTSADLDTEQPDAWRPVPWRPAVPLTGAVTVGPDLVLTDGSFGVPVSVQRGDVPVNPPALLVGAVPEVADDPARDGTLVLAPDLAAGDLAYDVVGDLPQVPRTGPRGVLVALSGVVGGPSGSPAQTSYDVWLAADDRAREQRLRADLAGHGLRVVARDSAQEHREAFSAEGPALALRLAVLAGLVSVVLAASVLVVGVATSGASRARDLAALRVVGVPASTVRAAAVREHLVVATLGVLAGSVLGVAAAQVTLPLIPLFATRAARLPLVLDPVWPAVAVTVVGCLLLLCAVSVLVGRALAASATPARLREGR